MEIKHFLKAHTDGKKIKGGFHAEFCRLTICISRSRKSTSSHCLLLLVFDYLPKRQSSTKVD